MYIIVYVTYDNLDNRFEHRIPGVYFTKEQGLFNVALKNSSLSNEQRIKDFHYELKEN